MKRIKLIVFLCGIIGVVAFSCSLIEGRVTIPSNDSIVILNQVDGKIIQVLESLDENNHPKNYVWAISTTKNYIDSLSYLIDDNILYPSNLSDSFKLVNLKVTVSGKKYLNKNHVLTSPFYRVGFGYEFVITEINKK